MYMSKSMSMSMSKSKSMSMSESMPMSMSKSWLNLRCYFLCTTNILFRVL